jgi:hypothetical protein
MIIRDSVTVGISGLVQSQIENRSNRDNTSVIIGLIFTMVHLLLTKLDFVC